ncbi:cell division protein FtsQ/DivIB [Alkalihalobacterium elongatum]|uniref:cell division protein FtsQ/DivIB n=1 Tax=Alkalihalobacterium elongatum TaxID=2675466 RepID=UPI001C1F8065|nr:FtsQ-type POTRA domain-containing protein [Alkalihalobacterium elongatum]
MVDEKVITINDRIPKLKEQRKQRANRRLIFFLSFFFLLILLVIYFQSPLSHIKTIEVRGNYYLPSETIVKASRLQSGTSIWKLNEDEVIQRLINLKEIESVDLSRKFPNTIELHVVEHQRVAYMYQEGKYFPILSTGVFLDELPPNEMPVDAPILKDWEPGPVAQELATEITKLSDGLFNRISEIYYTPTETDPLRIIVYMNDGFEVHSTVRNFSEKIAPYPSIVKEIDSNKLGIIHMRMTPYFEEFIGEEEEEGEGEW